MSRVQDFGLLADFDCGDADLNEYFRHDVRAHKEQLLTETYIIHEAIGEIPVASFSLCNDSVFTKQTKWCIALPPPKDGYGSLPAVKIARFGVQQEFQGNDIGTHAINMIKKVFTTNNRTGCRLLTVDAYNRDGIPGFYEKNDFQFLTSGDERKKTRTMFFDLRRLYL